MMMLNTPDYAVIHDLAQRTGLGPDQVETGITLMRSGRVDLIAKVITGEMTVAAALAAARRRVGP